MLNMHSLLLVGPYDWDETVMPRAEFEERIRAFWARIPESAASFAVIYGDSRHHAEMAYLTHFVPRVRNAMAIVPRQGEPLMLLQGSRNSFSYAERLGCFKNLELMTDPAKAVDKWVADHPGTAKRAVLLGTAAMRAQQYRQLLAAFADNAAPLEASHTLNALMRVKRPREIAAIKRGCEILSAAAGVLAEAQRSGAQVTAAVLEAERAANAMGAQDVRSLFSLDGGATLRPFSTLIERKVDPLQVSMAVLNAGYWVEGLMHFPVKAHPVRERVAEALRVLTAQAKPGAKARDLASAVTAAIKPYSPHPITAGAVGNGIGMAIEEAPRLEANGDAALEAGGVYTLCAGATDGKQHAMLSAMVHVTGSGAEILWSAA
jgi:Xaa-Pro aminopeptidase